MGERNEIVHLQNLRTDVEMQAHKGGVCHFLCLADDCFHLVHGDAELVFRQSGGDVGMGVCAHIGIDAEADTCHAVHPCGNLVDDLEFGHAFHIEITYAGAQSQLNFPIAFSHSGIDDAVSGKAGIEAGLDFASTHAVGAQSGFLYETKHIGVDFFLYGVNRILQQTGVVVVKRCFYAFELLAR